MNRSRSQFCVKSETARTNIKLSLAVSKGTINKNGSRTSVQWRDDLSSSGASSDSTSKQRHKSTLIRPRAEKVKYYIYHNNFIVPATLTQ